MWHNPRGSSRFPRADGLILRCAGISRLGSSSLMKALLASMWCLEFPRSREFVLTLVLPPQGEQGEDGKAEGPPGPPGDRVRAPTIKQSDLPLIPSILQRMGKGPGLEARPDSPGEHGIQL